MQANADEFLQHFSIWLNETYGKVLTIPANMILSH